MYSIMNVIYGIPLTRKINALIDKWETTDDDRWSEGLNEKRDTCGFITLYHGSADRIIGFCGVSLGEFTECDEIIKIEDDTIKISEDSVPKSMRSGPRRPPSIVKLKPSEKEIAKTQKMISKLDPEIQKIAPSVGIYIITSTS